MSDFKFPCPVCGASVSIDDAGRHGRWHAEEEMKQIKAKYREGKS